MPPPSARIVMLCTGNAARSVMGAAMLRERGSHFEVSGAGTHALEGLPMSRRTRNALAAHGLAEPHHRSHQLVDADVRDADLVVGFAPEHVAYVRRRHSDAAPRTATLHHLVHSLAADDSSERLTDRVKALQLDEVELDGAQEVVDPAGGDEATFVACADEINRLIDRLALLL